MIKEHIIKLLEKNARLDGRTPLDYRKDVKIEYGISKSAEGSARIVIGETEVIAGVKLEVGAPYPDTPDKGGIMVGAELLPLASPDFESGPPSIEAIELARVVDRGIRESETIDLKKLCIREGELVWTVIIDICPLNNAGNLYDAAALAALAALKDATFPTLDENDVIDYKNPTDKHVEIDKLPISVTVRKIGKTLIVDPTYEEEQFVDARLTVASLDDGTLCALQKGEEDTFTVEEINEAVKIALDKAKELRKVLG